jgi:hypothetical protein
VTSITQLEPAASELPHGAELGVIVNGEELVSAILLIESSVPPVFLSVTVLVVGLLLGF